MFLFRDNTITYRGVAIEKVTPEKRARAFSLMTGASPRLSQIVANGGFASPTETKAVARQFRITTIDTSEAREKGLIQ